MHIYRAMKVYALFYHAVFVYTGFTIILCVIKMIALVSEIVVMSTKKYDNESKFLLLDVY